MNKIIILGCGYIGTNVANYIAKNYNEDVYVIGYKNEYVEYLDVKVKFKEMLIQDISMDEIEMFENAICIDATGNTNASDSLETAGIRCFENCIQKIHLINMLYKLKVKKYMFLSSGGTIYGDSKKKHRETEKNTPLNIYALEKTILEQFLNINSIENDKFDYIVLRVSNPYGGIVSLEKKQGIIDVTINKILKGEKVDFYGDINNVRDYIYIDDLSEAIYKLALFGNKNEIYNVGTGKGYSIKDIFIQIEQIYKTKIEFNKCDSIKSINIKSNVLNINKLKRDINFSPTTTLKKGIEKIKKDRKLK